MANGRYPLRLMETFRTVFYTPIYVTLAGGYLESAGLDVEFATCPTRFPHPLSALNHGAADIVQSGIMRSIIAADWGAETVPRHFAEINSRDGFFVLGRKRAEEFQWDDFEGSSIIPVGFSPMPWASFRYALRRRGLDPEGLTLLPGLGLDEAVAAFRHGRADFIQLPEPTVERLLAEGVGHLSVALGLVNGYIAYSSFAATNRFLEARAEVAQRFVQGYAQALEWLGGASANEVSAAVAPFFPDNDPELITRAIRRYQEQQTWPASPHLGRSEYEGLQDILVDAGMVRERQVYEKVVATEFTAR